MRVCIGFVLVLAGLGIGQERAVVFDFQPMGVDTNTCEVASMLLRGRLTDIGTYRLVDPEPGTRAYTIDEAVAAAQPLGVEKAVTGSIARIGLKIIISYRVIELATGSVTLTDRATIGTLDELDMAVDRIAQAISEKQTFNQTGEVGKLTGVETRSKAAATAFYFNTGYAFPLMQQIPADPGLMLFTIDASVAYETPNLLALGNLGLRRGKHDYNEVYFDLLVHKLFSKLDITPYVGGGVGVHRLSVQVPGQSYWEEVEDDGLALVGSAGVILFRTQYFRVLTGVKATAVITEDFGTNVFASFGFGLSSPTLGPGGGVNAPAGCVYGALGAFFLTGVIVALTT